MREILFRGKQTDSGKWMEGCYAVVGERKVIIAPPEMFYDENAKQCYGSEIKDIDPETLCQYTGLTDKNGRKIFEGDIVKEDWGSFKAIIRFGEFESQVLKNIGFNLEWFGGVGYRQDLPYWTDKIEVIGNIFDNPELIGNGEPQEWKIFLMEKFSEVN